MPRKKKPKLTIEYGEIPGPVWVDGCGHPKDSYVCSFEVYEGRGEINRYDLYVFPQPTFGQEVCLRYGEEPSEYCSPGEILHVAEASHLLERYRRALQLLRLKGTLTWVKKA